MAKRETDERTAQGVEGDWVQVGLIGGTHGVRGDVKLKSFTTVAETIKSFKKLHVGADGDVLDIKIFRPVKGGFAAHIKGVDTPEDAKRFNGTKLYVPREALGVEEEDEFFLADLIALTVEDMSGNEIGMIRTVENFGADDLLDIILHKPLKGFGTAAMVPFTKNLVPIVDIEKGFVTVNLDLWAELQVEAKAETTDSYGEEA